MLLVTERMECFECCKRSVPFVMLCGAILAMTITGFCQTSEQNVYMKELDSFYGTFHSQVEALQVIHYTRTREASIILRQFKRVQRKRPRTREGINRNPFIVVEGLYSEGGRRAMSCFLASRFNGIHLENPPRMYYDIRHTLMRHTSHFRRAFFSLANYVVARQASGWLNKRPVFISRYWHNFATYAIAKATANKTYMMPPKNSLVYSWPADLLKPDYVFFVNTTTQDQMDYWSVSPTKGFQQRRVEAFGNMYDPNLIDISCKGTLNSATNRIVDYLVNAKVFQ